MSTPPPFAVDASRTTSAVHATQTLSPLARANINSKSSHFDLARWWSTRLTLIGVFLSLFSYLSSMEVLDTCKAIIHTSGSPERRAQQVDDKHSQSVFIVLFHVIFVFLALGSIADYSTGKKKSSSSGGGGGGDGVTMGTCGKLCLFWFVDAVVAYFWRVLLYFYVVLPFGFAKEMIKNCGTSKAISGHTHFYCFHLLQLIYLVWSNYSSSPFLNNNKKKKEKEKERITAGATLGDSSDPQFFSTILRWSLQLYALVVLSWTLLTLERTYALGFHSLRHMIAGFAAALFTMGVYVSSFFNGCVF